MEARAPGPFLLAAARGCARLHWRSSSSPSARERYVPVSRNEFGVQAIVGALADGLVVADGQRRIRLMNDAFCQMFEIGRQTIDGSLLERCATRQSNVY